MRKGKKVEKSEEEVQNRITKWIGADSLTVLLLVGGRVDRIGD